MKLIEFVSVSEYERVGDAWLTFGKYVGEWGFYICFCIPVGIMTRRDFSRACETTGEYAYRIYFSMRQIDEEPVFPSIRAWLECVKPMLFVTDEQRLINYYA